MYYYAKIPYNTNLVDGEVEAPCWQEEEGAGTGEVDQSYEAEVPLEA